MTNGCNFTYSTTTINTTITAPALIRLEGPELRYASAKVYYINSQGQKELIGQLSNEKRDLLVTKSGDYEIELTVNDCLDTPPQIVIIPITEYSGLSTVPMYDVYPGKGADCETTFLGQTFTAGNPFAYIDAFPLDIGNSNPQGITEDSNYFYVVDPVSNQVNRYAKLTFAFVDALPLDAGNSNPQGITEDSTYLYVVDTVSFEINRYTKSPFTFVDALPLNIANTAPVGITEDFTYLYVVDDNGQIYRYTKSPFAFVDMLPLNPVNSSPQGIAKDTNYIYVVNSGLFDQIYRYAKTPFALVDILPLDPATTAPTGITEDVNYIYVVSGSTDDHIHRYAKESGDLVTYTKTADSGSGDFTVVYKFIDQATSDRFLAIMAVVAGPQNRTGFNVAGPWMHPRQIDAYVQDGLFVTVNWDHTDIEEDTPDPLILPCEDPVIDDDYDTSNDALRGFYEAIPLDTPQTPTQDFIYGVIQYVATGLECDEIKQVEKILSDGTVEPGGYINPDGSAHELKGTPSLSCPNGITSIVTRKYKVDCAVIEAQVTLKTSCVGETVCRGYVTDAGDSPYEVGDELSAEEIASFEPTDYVSGIVINDAMQLTVDHVLPAGFTSAMIDNNGNLPIVVNGLNILPGNVQEYGGVGLEYTTPLNITIPVGGSAQLKWEEFSVIPCAQDDVFDGLPVDIATTIDTKLNDTICSDFAGATWIFGNQINCTVVNNNDGTFDVTPTICDIVWSFEYTVTCADGASDTANVSGYTDPTLVSATLHLNNETDATFIVETDDGTDYQIDWGDGPPEVFNSGATASHTYGVAYTGDVILSYSGCTVVRRLDIIGAFDGDADLITAQLPYLTRMVAGARNLLSGIASDITLNAPGITNLQIGGLNTLSGIAGDITLNAPGMTTLSIIGFNTLSSIASDITLNAPGITNLQIIGLNTLSGIAGDITLNAPGIIVLQIDGSNTFSGIAGDVTLNAPGMTHFVIGGLNTITVPAPPIFNTTMRHVQLHGVAKTQAEVDNMLSGGVAITTWTLEKIFDVAGLNAAPSASPGIDTYAPAIFANGAALVKWTGGQLP